MGTLLSPPQDRSRSPQHPLSLPPLLGTRRHPGAAWSPPGPGPHGGGPGDPTRQPTQGQRVGRPVDSHGRCVHHQTVLAAHRLPLKGTDPSPGSPHCWAEPCLHGGRRRARGAEAPSLAQGLHRRLLTRGCDHTRLHSVCALPVCACTLAQAFRPVRTRGTLSHTPAPNVHVWAGSPQGRACPCTRACACMHTHIHACIETSLCRSACALAHAQSTVLGAGSPVLPVPSCPRCPPCPAHPPRWSFPSAAGGCLGARQEGTQPRVPSAAAGGISMCTELLRSAAVTPHPQGWGGSPACLRPFPRGMRVLCVSWVLCQGGHGCCLWIRDLFAGCSRGACPGHLYPCSLFILQVITFFTPR